MKIKKPKRIMSLFLAALMCVTSLVGMGTTAYAAEETDDVYLISFPRDGDSNYNAEWGHGSLTFMNGWKTGTSRYTTVRAMGSYEGNICYCIEIGVPQQTGDSFTKKGEDFWDNYPSSYNSTISPDDIKLFIGRIFQYGYTGTISTSWRSQNEGGDKLAHAVATQLLIWETVIGERDENFNKVSTGGKDAVLDQISPNHPLYDKIMSYYNSMAASVQKHSKLPSFLSKTPGSAQEIELEWDGSKYTVTLTDSNNVLSGYKFSSNDSGVQFSVSGNKLTITAEKAPSDGLTITAEKTAQRKGVITWTDGIYGPNGGVQDTVTYAQTVNDPVKGFLKLKVSYGSAKIVKTSEDGKVDGISFRIQGNGIDKTVKTENGGQIQVDIKRHKKILWNSTKKISYVCAFLVAAVLAGVYLLPEEKTVINEIVMTWLPYFVFIMYAINRGTNFTQALFMNCDHSLLTYSFYKQPSFILRLFQIRLREIMKINAVPALVIGIGLALILFATGGTDNPLNYVVLVVSILCMSLFFSIHYLTIYYLLQPYNAGTELKSGTYRIVLSVTYVICFALMRLRMPIMIFGIMTIVFCVLYSIVASILVYRLAPKTFRLRT